jgi:competence protein ComEC
VTRDSWFARIFLTVFLVLFSNSVFFGLQIPAVQQTFKIVFFDVGQGDAALIRTPSSKNILVDAGPSADAILSYFKKNKINSLDAVIISHTHPDHIGGLPAILKQVKVDKIYETGHDSGDPEYKEVLALARAGGIRREPVFEGDSLALTPELKIEVLGPPREKAFEDFNDYSLVIRLTFGRVSVLLPGDAGKEAETRLVEKYGDKLKSTVLKAPHHGSHNGSITAFISKVRPELVVISCGLDNAFGHPASTTLFRYKKSGAKIFRTDYNGTITLTSDGSKFTAETEKF